MAIGFLFLLELFVTLLYSSLAGGELGFASEPTTKSVLEGNDVTFPCTVIDYDPVLHTVLWFRSDTPITNNTVVLTLDDDRDRISVVTGPTVGQFNLHITDVRRADDHNYHCTVCDRKNPETILIQSANVRLDVQTTPGPQYPRCSPLEKADYVEGETVTTVCNSVRGNPPVVLQWYQGSQKVASYQDDADGIRSATHTIVIAASHNGAVFQCKMTTNAIATYEKSCTVGPLSVFYRPKVTIVPNQEIYRVGDKIVLDCDSNANPAPYDHQWSTPDFRRYKFLETRRYLETTAAAELNGTTFSCNATNQIGSGQSSSIRIIVMARSDVGTDIKPANFPGSVNGGSGGAQELPEQGTSSSSPEELNNMFLLLVIAILSVMIITLAIVLLLKCHHNHRRPSNADLVYNGPSTIFNSNNIDRAWDGNSIYYEPQDQISVTYDPMWQTTLPLPPELQRNVGVQVPYTEDPHYAEITLDWDEEHGTLEL